MFDCRRTCRNLLTAALLAAGVWAPGSVAHAQQVVVIVNGEPITALDIEQRSKLAELSMHKAPPRQEVLDELINEKLKVREAKKWGLEVSNSEVDQAYASMAGRMRLTADQLTQQLAKSGLNARGPAVSGGGGKPARSREEIELVFDRNKGRIYSLYARALRDNAELQGKLVLEFTIAPTGEVTMCRVAKATRALPPRGGTRPAPANRSGPARRGRYRAPRRARARRR